MAVDGGSGGGGGGYLKSCFGRGEGGARKRDGVWGWFSLRGTNEKGEKKEKMKRKKKRCKKNAEICCGV